MSRKRPNPGYDSPSGPPMSDADLAALGAPSSDAESVSLERRAEELIPKLLEQADWLAKFLAWQNDGTVSTADGGYDNPKETHPQHIDGPYEIYRVLDIDEDDSGMGPLQTLLRRTQEVIEQLLSENRQMDIARLERLADLADEEKIEWVNRGAKVLRERTEAADQRVREFQERLEQAGLDGWMSPSEQAQWVWLHAEERFSAQSTIASLRQDLHRVRAEREAYREVLTAIADCLPGVEIHVHEDLGDLYSEMARSVLEARRILSESRPPGGRREAPDALLAENEKDGDS